VSFARHRAAVARAVAVARALNDAATESVPAAEAARREAFALFEENDIQPAEARWKQALALEENTDRLRGNVWKALDQAVALDPRDAAARALYADVILQRLLAAERLHQTTLVGPLRAQLGIYDDGSRASALLAPGHVRFEIEPPEATMSLARYREDGAGRLVEGDVAPIVGGASRELEPGSYILVAAAPGRYSTRYPFLVRRGEKSALRIVLPRAEDVPAGMIYVPAGRTLYGSGDDEPTRGFLTHQPMHDIDVAAFLMARTEVTNAQYLAFLHALPDDVAKQRLPLGLKRLGDGRIAWTYRDRVLNPGEPYCSGVQPCVDWSLLPVLGTSWEDGEQFAAWLWRSGQLPGARLCTDREWERGARGADDRRFPSGDGDLLPTDACTLATYGGDTTRAGPCAAGTHPASRSPFGVDDLAGSMLEWTAGPADVANPAETTVRSGSFLYSGLNQTIPNRSVALSGRESDYGLRICAGAK
jgi:formylglycine-generating enzyme required for sulfatase activity